MQAWQNEGPQVTQPMNFATADAAFGYLANARNGVPLASTMELWQSQGLGGSQIDAWSLIRTSRPSLDAAIHSLGGVIVSFYVPQTDLALPSGQAWTIANSSRRLGIAGAHAAAAIGYDSRYLYLVNWGHIQQVSWTWWTHYGIQSVAVLPHSFVATGSTPTTPVSAVLASYFAE